MEVFPQIARFMGSTWDPPGSCRPQMGPMLAPWTLLSGSLHTESSTNELSWHFISVGTNNISQLQCSLCKKQDDGSASKMRRRHLICKTTDLSLWTHNPRMTSQWRHNGHDSVSNHQPHDCFLNRLFRHSPKKTSKLRVTGLCAGNSPEAGEFPEQMASNAGNVSIWWRHHELTTPRKLIWRAHQVYWNTPTII